jgi:hypothetical protein
MSIERHAFVAVNAKNRLCFAGGFAGERSLGAKLIKDGFR